ncbi:hypothetical protein PIB30_057290 [Stylosanthes scabra]|uniref:Ubiquitin carboxyl-terminal hydrolase n=1 Tax=Stylosanthes scabra TaxID=79078 RepID=A0ABU6UML7_9FABA|nr:hypothetical protein [Stylosanthes scabra]
MAKRSKNEIRRQRRGKSAATRRPSAAARKRNAPDEDDDDQDSPPPPPPRPLPPPTAPAPPSSATPQEPLPLPPPPGFEDVNPIYDAEVFKNLEPLRTVKPSESSSSLLVTDLSGKEYMNSSIQDSALPCSTISIPKFPELDELLEPEEIGLIDNSSSDDYDNSDEDDKDDPHTPRGAFEDDDDLYRYKMFMLQQNYYSEICENEILDIPVPTRLTIKFDGGSQQQQGAAEPESSRAADSCSDDPSSPTVGAGLYNEGMTCYVNVILQCLTHTVPFVHAIRSCNHPDPCECIAYHIQSGSYCAICALRDHINASLQTPRHPVRPTRLADNLNYFSPEFRKGKQEDSHEFMLAVFDRITACFPKEVANPVDTVFGGELVSRLTCCNCAKGSDKPEPLTGLNLEIENVESVKGALDSFTQVEKVEATCENCREHGIKEKQLFLSKTPQILVLQLKRFKKDERRSTYTKIDKLVSYQSALDLKEYTPGKVENVKFKYDLYAVVVHSGKLSSGHYYCYVRTDENNWHKLDDLQVSGVNEEEALDNELAYLLFYAQHGTPWFVSSVIGGKPVDAKPEQENAMDACNENAAKDDAQEKVDDHGDHMDACNENAATDHTQEKVFDDDPMDAYNESGGTGTPDEELTDEGSPCGQKNL